MAIPKRQNAFNGSEVEFLKRYIPKLEAAIKRDEGKITERKRKLEAAKTKLQELEK
jgi:flagellar biosynthesis chaperone FliJ